MGVLEGGLQGVCIDSHILKKNVSFIEKLG